VTDNNKIYKRVRKQKVRPAFEDRQGIGINFKDDTYKQASLRFSVQRGTKQQKEMSEFINSRVIIANSQNNRIVSLSNLPKIS
jgi:hypothetical protein